jgi:hypothetical protein
MAPKPRHAHRRAQLPGFGLLLTRYRESTFEIALRFCRIRGGANVGASPRRLHVRPTKLCPSFRQFGCIRGPSQTTSTCSQSLGVTLSSALGPHVFFGAGASAPRWNRVDPGQLTGQTAALVLALAQDAKANAAAQAQRNQETILAAVPRIK